MVRWYLAQHDLHSISPLLAQEVQVPHILSPVSPEPGDGTSSSRRISIYRNNVWLGGHAGSASPCHYDPFHNLLVQIYGAKRVLLFDPQDSAGLYPALTTVQKNTSLIRSFEHEDGLGGVSADGSTRSGAFAGEGAGAGAGAGYFPLYKDVQGYEVVLQPGDALYIPYKWWHYCSTTSASCSANWWYL